MLAGIGLKRERLAQVGRANQYEPPRLGISDRRPAAGDIEQLVDHAVR